MPTSCFAKMMAEYQLRHLNIQNRCQKTQIWRRKFRNSNHSRDIGSNESNQAGTGLRGRFERRNANNKRDATKPKQPNQANQTFCHFFIVGKIEKHSFIA